MAQRKQQQQTTHIVDQGDGWHVARDSATRDYAAYITRNQQGYIGSTATPSAARELIFATLIAQNQHSAPEVLR